MTFIPSTPRILAPVTPLPPSDPEATIPVYFYGLFDSRNQDDLRYIGQTIDPPARFARHLAKPSRLVGEWFEEMAAVGAQPEIRILTMIGVRPDELTKGGVAAGRAELVEKALIEAFAGFVPRLLNSVGVEGRIGYQHTAQRRIGPKGDHASPYAGQRMLRTNVKTGGNKAGCCALPGCAAPYVEGHAIALEYKRGTWLYCSNDHRALDDATGLWSKDPLARTSSETLEEWRTRFIF